MSNTVTITGRMVSDADLRFTAKGAAVATFTLADTPRKKQGDQWVDGVTLFIKCSVWRQQAENLAESVRKGDLVTVTGKLAQENWEAKDGTKRSAVVVDVSEVSAALGQHPVKVQRTERSKPKADDDPWGSAPADAGFRPDGKEIDF